MGRHRRNREKDIDEAEQNINQILSESGKKEELREKLVKKLEEIGWKDQVKLVCRDVVKEKGLDKISVEDLVQEMGPKGSQLVPDSVRMELLKEVRDYLEQRADD
ncbi:transcription and mRNA export factor ENY2-1 [Eurytemora carolleeae]|uniref:transcription and mRNA export factor ENY2-1 n=1 Tax=Eurytemora carolleeae TaxID=1294199 RepID=UPI000C778D91|nr:transcription and mRNA export factor ENY2-1 [Eurytemora carolleeae]|eukprot:XP_023335621.1 transcription and mRNA export factor ENY2-1-like [Eurytemora affinis]